MRTGKKDKRHAWVWNTLRLLLVVSVFAALFLSGVLDAGMIGRTLAYPLHFLLGGACLLLSYVFSIFRWRRLLEAQEIHVSLAEATSLSFIGLFFSSLIPGAVSGDLVKGYYVARGRQRKAEAIVSILMDRALGLYCMVSLAAVGLAMVWCGNLIPESESLRADARILGIALVVWALLIVLTLGFFFASSERLWSLPMLRWIFEKAPLGKTLQALHEATVIYARLPRQTLRALGWSYLAQVPLLASIWVMALSMHVEGISFGSYLFVLPVGLIANALPLLPGGLGQAEAALEWLFSLFGSHEGAETALLFHLAQMILSLGTGGICYLFWRRPPAEG